MSYKQHFSKALSADPKRIHMAAHSHHLWPDVTCDAHMQSWLDAAAMADRKWPDVFDTLIPAVQQGIANILGLSKPENIAFEQNTHALLQRILSCFEHDFPIRILTTDGEFHSFERQVKRLEEAGKVEVLRVPCKPYEDFSDRFSEKARKEGWDLVFFSHVFFNSGYAVPDLEAIIERITSNETMVVIDGYHGFMAVPTSLKAIENRVFYLAGGYKYAMAGEGACFMHVPDGYGMRPVNTGWLASFETLEQGKGGMVPYAGNGSRFMGATFDPTALYRLRAVLQWLQQEKITVETIDAHVKALQEYFIEQLVELQDQYLHADGMITAGGSLPGGHFLTFDLSQAEILYRKLLQQHVVTDYRGTCLRFGFGLYHDAGDIDELFRRWKN